MSGMKRQTDWCERHWRRIRVDPRINGIQAGILLVQRLMEDEEFQKLCGASPAMGTPARVELVNQVKARISPVCCFLGEERMEQLYREAMIR